MKAAMQDHGLDPPRLDIESGHFQVVFPGPGENMDRIRVQRDHVPELVSPSVESQLNDRQAAMVRSLLDGESLTSRWCVEEFRITRDTAARDLGELVEHGIAEKVGAGRSTRYVLAGGS
jgi:predicted HTH transcriptional regulator